jgi:hypothetical protein
MSDEQEIPQSIPDAEPLPAAPAPSEAPAPAPSEAPLHWTKESAETDYAKHFAKDEDISNYREFRKDIDDYSDGVEFSDDRRRDFQHRIKQATREASAAADGLAVPPDLGPGYVSREEAQQAVEQASNFARAQTRMETYFPDPEVRRHIGETISFYQPGQAIIDTLTESQLAPQIVERLYQHPEAIEVLNNMSPAEARRQLAKLEGAIEAEQNFAAQNGYTTQPRRVSKAPPPITSPRGGANPPSDAFQVAKRGEDATDYVRWRQQQEKRR